MELTPDRQDGELTRESLAAKLAANPAFLAALLDAESESWDGPGIEASAMIEAANGRRQAAGENKKEKEQQNP